MPQELMKEFIGKVCTIILFNESFGVQGKIVAVEDNWIKVEEKNKVRLITNLLNELILNFYKHQFCIINYSLLTIIFKAFSLGSNITCPHPSHFNLKSIPTLVISHILLPQG